MIRKLAGLLAVFAILALDRLRLQRPAAAGRRHQGSVVRGAEPVPAPRRPRAQPRQHRQGLRRAGREGADGSDQRARQRRRHQGHARARQRPGRVRRSSSRRRASCRARCRGCSWSVENYPQLKSDALFRDLQSQLEGHREPHHRRAQPLHQVGAGVQHDGAQFPTNLTAMLFKMDVKPNFAVDERGRDQRAAQGRLQQGAGGAARAGARAEGRRARRRQAWRRSGDAAAELLKKGY